MNVIFTLHAKNRLEKRKITEDEVENLKRENKKEFKNKSKSKEFSSENLSYSKN